LPLDDQVDRIKVSVDPDLETLIPSFLQHRSEEITLLQEALNRADYDEIQRIGHTIKGVGGGYGFKGLTPIATAIELAAKERHDEGIRIGLKDYSDYLNQIDIVYECVPEEPLVVCVDDEPTMLRLLERTLTKSGFRMMGSLGGDHALSLIHKHKPNLIFMDIKMPGISGFDICSRLHESADVAAIPVIFVTGLAGENDRAAALASGAVDLLLKPVDLDVLVRKARQTLQATTQ
jgi:CheY-like chemotaxis protein/HPt (histidine-containing phosphotransfer) domain-containing protein